MNNRKKYVQEEVEAFLLEHWNSMPHWKIEQHLRMRRSTLYSIVEKLGLPVRHKRNIYEDIVDEIAAMYPETSNHDIMKKFNITYRALTYLRDRYGFRKSEEYMRKNWQRLAGMSKGKVVSEESREKIRQSRKKLFRRERFRILSGEAQKTKINANGLPKKTLKRRCSLVSVRGYIRTTDPWTLWYNENTKRETRSVAGTEQYITEHYHLKFEPEPKDENS